MAPIFYVATGCWVALILWAVIAICRREDHLQDQRSEAAYRRMREIGRNHLAQLAELESINDLAVLEAFRIKEGLA